MKKRLIAMLLCTSILTAAVNAFASQEEEDFNRVKDVTTIRVLVGSLFCAGINDNINRTLISPAYIKTNITPGMNWMVNNYHPPYNYRITKVQFPWVCADAIYRVSGGWVSKKFKFKISKEHEKYYLMPVKSEFAAGTLFVNPWADLTEYEGLTPQTKYLYDPSEMPDNY